MVINITCCYTPTLHDGTLTLRADTSTLHDATLTLRVDTLTLHEGTLTLRPYTSTSYADTSTLTCCSFTNVTFHADTLTLCADTSS